MEQVILPSGNMGQRGQKCGRRAGQTQAPQGMSYTQRTNIVLDENDVTLCTEHLPRSISVKGVLVRITMNNNGEWGNQVWITMVNEAIRL
jgi:hypothetical protein